MVQKIRLRLAVLLRQTALFTHLSGNPDSRKDALMRTKSLLTAGVLVGVLIAIAQIVSFAQRGSSNAAVIGVWRVSEVTTTGPNGRKTTNPQPGVRIFTQRYYSIDEVTSDAPRPELPPQGKATDKQVADAFGPFTGQAGTYEIKGNELTTKRIAAKNPGTMKAGTFTTVTFRMEGKDTLWLTAKTDQNGPIANPTTTKLTRLE
jgi:hypothetical protein